MTVARARNHQIGNFRISSNIHRYVQSCSGQTSAFRRTKNTLEDGLALSFRRVQSASLTLVAAGSCGAHSPEWYSPQQHHRQPRIWSHGWSPSHSASLPLAFLPLSPPLRLLSAAPPCPRVEERAPRRVFSVCLAVGSENLPPPRASVCRLPRARASTYEHGLSASCRGVEGGRGLARPLEKR